jgi:predicted heme/steroid binding protein
MTPEELAKFNGDDESLPLYLAIAGEIYDVTDGRSHYGKGGGYAGKKSR